MIISFTTIIQIWIITFVYITLHCITFELVFLSSNELYIQH